MEFVYVHTMLSYKVTFFQQSSGFYRSIIVTIVLVISGLPSITVYCVGKL
jgi:hypothetical protein